MLTATTVIHICVDEQLKTQAEDALVTMGMTISHAVQSFLMRVVADKKMPFSINVPNAQTRSAIAESEKVSRAHSAKFTSPESKFNAVQKGSRWKTMSCALKFKCDLPVNQLRDDVSSSLELFQRVVAVKPMPLS